MAGSTPRSTRSRPRPLPEWRFDALGTAWQVDTATPVSTTDRESVEALVEDFDRTWSRFRTDGAISALRRGETVDLGPDAAPLLDLYDRLADLTDGAVDPCVGGSLERLGYDADYTLREHGQPAAAPAWSSCRRSGSVLTLPPGTTLDVGAAGKGRLADLVARLLDRPCIVDASGDIVNATADVLRVALEHPADPRRAIGIAEVPPGAAICGSAVNRRAWGDGLHHVLDARTGRPVHEVVATWAVGPTAAEADAVSTALFFVSAERLSGALPASSVTVSRGGKISSHHFPGEVFS